MGTHLKVAVLYGTTREGRFCDTVASWLVEHLSEVRDFSLDVIDPLLLDLPARYELADGPETEAYQARIAAADAFIVLTAEYNHGYTAALKHLIDAAREEWRAKPVGFVSYGGLAGGLRAVEQLRLVFAELSAVGLRDTVSFHNPWRMLDQNGRLLATPAAVAALRDLTNHLRWWAKVLKAGRQDFPMPSAA